MRNATAKALWDVARDTVGLKGRERKYYRFLKKRYNQTPRKERYKFFEKFQQV